MAFEVFTREFVRTTAPKVTITTMGRLAINNAATDLLRQSSQAFVLLLWDKETHRIAIRPLQKEESRSYALKSYGPKGKSGTGFSCVTFLNYINYDWSKTRSFDAEWTENMLIFSIPKEHLTGKQESLFGKGKKKKAE